jgi:hypothetical protein
MKAPHILAIALFATLIQMPVSWATTDDGAPSTDSNTTFEWGPHGGPAPHGGPVVHGGYHGGGYGPVVVVHPGPRPMPVIPHPYHVHDVYTVHNEYHPWGHWEHPYFVRPVYGFDWVRVRAMTCTATDVYGEQFPVTSADYAGWGYQSRMITIEDMALDRCFSETRDAGCHLVGCYPTYGY